MFKKGIGAKNETLALEMAKRLSGNASIEEDILELYWNTNEFLLVKGYISERFKIEEMAQKLLGETSIHKASDDGNLLAVKVLIFINGCNVDEIDQFRKNTSSCYIEHETKAGWTSLICASIKGHECIVELLIENVCNISHKDNYDRTALVWALEHRHADITESLIQKGCDVNPADLDGLTALICASGSGHKDIANC